MNQHKAILTIGLFLGYVVLWYLKRRELMRTHGVEANVIFLAERPIQRYFGFLEKVMTAAIVIIIGIHALAFGKLTMTTPLIGDHAGVLDFLGLGIGLAGLALCRVAQSTIGASWRVGIDESARPGLVTVGIYRYIRNPTYTGLFILCAGVWMINPTSLVIVWIALFVVMMEFQVRCEEEYLERQYGTDYRDYVKRTGRYVPQLW